MLTKRTVLLAATGLLIGYVAAAQPAATVSAPDSNDFLLGVIIGLLGLVAVAVVLTGFLVTTQLKNRRQRLANTPEAPARENQPMLKQLLKSPRPAQMAVVLWLLSTLQAVAQAPEAAAAPVKAAAMTSQELLFWTLIGLLVFLVLVLVLAFVGIVVQMRPQLRKVYDMPTVRHSWSGQFLGLLVGDPVLVRGEVRDEMLDHDYDGIHEFDNDLPPWWKYGFYVTIVFAVGYLGYYHLLQAGPLQGAEYAAEMQQAALFVSAEADDPNQLTTYQPLAAAADLSSGKALFATNCAPCHGTSAEGKVGPNLTDDYWLHGGEVNHVYKTIKFGVQGKGMVAWKGKLSGKQILQVSSYILSLQGSKPADAKEPQGEKEAPGKVLASR